MYSWEQSCNRENCQSLLSQTSKHTGEIYQYDVLNRYINKSSLFLAVIWHLLSTKPFPKPMLIYFSLDPNDISASVINRIQIWKCILNNSVQNVLITGKLNQITHSGASSVAITNNIQSHRVWPYNMLSFKPQIWLETSRDLRKTYFPTLEWLADVNIIVNFYTSTNQG